MRECTDEAVQDGAQGEMRAAVPERVLVQSLPLDGAACSHQTMISFVLRTKYGCKILCLKCALYVYYLVMFITAFVKIMS